MPQAGRPDWPDTTGPALPDSGELNPLADDLDSDLAHLFDYCRALLGQDAEAARTARSVLDSMREPQPDPEWLRAGLFGLARSLAHALRPPGSDQPAYMPWALIETSGQHADSSVVRAFRALTDRDREILDLVYRHGIRPADLPSVLIAAPEEAYRCLAAAEEEFISLASDPKGGPGSGLEDIAALPLAALPLADLPATEGERQLEDQPARRPDGAAPRRPVTRRRLQFATALVIPVAAILGAVMFLGAPGHPAASGGAGVLPGSGASQTNQRAGTHGSPHAGSSAQSGHSGHSPAPGQPGYPGPVASPSAIPEPTSSLPNSVTGLAATVNQLPCLAGTKANFRWHYSANGSPGGWSGTATHACPGSLTMGPQAMGNLQVTPGTTLEAGYDFTLPGNNKSLTMTVSAAWVTFAVSCVSKAVPLAPTLTVPLLPETYQITGSQWYPSGDQASPLVYQGSVPVPALCGPAGQISLAKGGTFAATLS